MNNQNSTTLKTHIFLENFIKKSLNKKAGITINHKNTYQVIIHQVDFRIKLSLFESSIFHKNSTKNVETKVSQNQ